MSIISIYYIRSEYNNNYFEFLAPGLTIMIIMQNSYQNISETLIEMKQLGSFNDYLLAPINRIEILFALILSSILISLFMGFVIILIINFFVNYNNINYLLIAYYLFITSLIFSSIGSIVGFLFYTWDAQQSFFNFFIIPVSFLSGTFFSINSLNSNWIFLLKYNPFYYLIDNFRMIFLDDNKFDYGENLFLFIFSLSILFISAYIYKNGYKVIN